MDKQKELEKIANEIENCEVCKVGKSGKAVVGEGNPDAKVVFIGEAPGKNEALVGRPFIGRSGKLLRTMIVSIGLKESDVYITSPVKYLPDRPARQSPDASSRLAGGGTPTSQDIAHGRVHLLAQLSVIKPQIVVLLGRVAAEGVLQNPTSPRLRAARKVQVMREHGQIIDSINGVKYFLTLHPAAAIRFAKNMPLFKSDFRKIKTILGL